MDLKSLEAYQRRQRRLRIWNLGLLAALAAVLTCLWAWGGRGLPPADIRLWNSVRSAQDVLWQWRQTLDSQDFDPLTDPHHTGLIGLEWSPLSTTLGHLPSKRTACDPRWALVMSRWMEDLGVQPGETVAVFSSSSFPGLILNTLMALESRQIRPVLVLSLGSSTWGANDPAAPWPKMAEELRLRGLLHTRAVAYTLGGDNECGGGLAPETRQEMRNFAASEGVPLIELGSLEAMILWKMDLIARMDPKVVISIGGSHANMGNGEDILRLPPGLLKGGRSDGGDGVIGRALRAGYPVIHLLSIRSLVAAEGIPFDAAPGLTFRGPRTLGAALAALILFAGVMAFFRRWAMDEEME